MGGVIEWVCQQRAKKMSIPVSAQSDPVLGGIYQQITSSGSRYELICLNPLTIRTLEPRTMERLIDTTETSCDVDIISLDDLLAWEKIETPAGEEFECDPSIFRAEFALVG
jgi:hypothetical protein